MQGFRGQIKLYFWSKMIFFSDICFSMKTDKFLFEINPKGKKIIFWLSHWTKKLSIRIITLNTPWECPGFWRALAPIKECPLHADDAHILLLVMSKPVSLAQLPCWIWAKHNRKVKAIYFLGLFHFQVPLPYLVSIFIIIYSSLVPLPHSQHWLGGTQVYVYMQASTYKHVHHWRAQVTAFQWLEEFTVQVLVVLKWYTKYVRCKNFSSTDEPEDKQSSAYWTLRIKGST